MFSYDVAFSRNLGWTTEWEQAALRAKRVAIAGMGGVGGSHLLALTRLGIGAFSIADFDAFDLVNLNRQAGANAASMGRAKVDVMAEQAVAINPELRISRFAEGVTEQNLDRFLDGCDLVVDGLDFFVLDIRARMFARACERGIPAVTAAPIGMGAGFLAFLPGGQTFEQYFRLEGQPEQEQYLRFLMGVAPRGLHRSYLADDSRVDLAARRGPSTVAACELCAGMVATQALKILLGRGQVPAAPVHLTIDAYLGRAVRTRLRWGNAGPLQRAKRAVARAGLWGDGGAEPGAGAAGAAARPSRVCHPGCGTLGAERRQRAAMAVRDPGCGGGPGAHPSRRRRRRQPVRVSGRRTDPAGRRDAAGKPAHRRERAKPGVRVELGAAAGAGPLAARRRLPARAGDRAEPVAGGVADAFSGAATARARPPHRRGQARTEGGARPRPVRHLARDHA